MSYTFGVAFPRAEVDMLTEREAFIQAIREAPGDEALRLVFADWLDEHDDPLGPFIRLQVELEPTRLDLANARSASLCEQEEKTLRRHRRRWLGPVYPWTQNPEDATRVIFRRGFVEACEMPVDLFLKRGQTLYRRCPALHDVTLHDIRGRPVAELAQSPLLGGVRRLTLADWVPAREARTLAASPWLEKVTSLTLWLGHEDERACVRAFARGQLPALREVRLVQLHGGIQAGRKAAGLCARADEAAGEFNRARGEEIATVYRPFERRFPLNGDVGYGILAGYLPGGRPAIALPGERYMALVLFDEEGRFTELRRERPGCDPDNLEGRAREHFGFALGVIRVREFTTNPAIPRRKSPWFMTSQRRPKDEDIAVCQWPYGTVRMLEAPGTLPEGRTAKDRRESVRFMHSWMDDGDFLIDCGNDYWAGACGTITSS